MSEFTWHLKHPCCNSTDTWQMKLYCTVNPAGHNKGGRKKQKKRRRRKKEKFILFIYGAIITYKGKKREVYIIHLRSNSNMRG